MAVNKRILAITLILFAILLSSLRVLDDYADEYTSDAIASAAITYATARAINALVSMAQSSNIEAGVGVVSGSVTIGELLDPVNDLVERFSAIMTLALASLAAQKVLLLIASHQLFLVLIAVFGLASIAVIHAGRTAAFGIVVKVFLVLVFVRFSLGLAVSLNSAVDGLFLADTTRENDNRIAAFRQNLLTIDPQDDVSAEEIDRLQARKRQLLAETEAAQRRLDEQRQEKAPLIASRDQARQRLGQAREAAGVMNFFDADVVAARDALDTIETLLERLDGKIAAEERALQRLRAEIGDLERKIDGAPVNLVERIGQGSIDFWRRFDLDALEQKISDGIRSFMNLIAIYLLKTVVFPLLFFVAFYQAIRGLWAIRW